MNKPLLDLYSDYLLSSFEQTPATRLSRLLHGAISHDAITRFLSETCPTSKDVWHIVKRTFGRLNLQQISWLLMIVLKKNLTPMKMILSVGIMIMLMDVKPKESIS